MVYPLRGMPIWKNTLILSFGFHGDLILIHGGVSAFEDSFCVMICLRVVCRHTYCRADTLPVIDGIISIRAYTLIGFYQLFRLFGCIGFQYHGRLITADAIYIFFSKDLRDCPTVGNQIGVPLLMAVDVVKDEPDIERRIADAEKAVYAQTDQKEQK